jgi:hypothetical protein
VLQTFWYPYAEIDGLVELCKSLEGMRDELNTEAYELLARALSRLTECLDDHVKIQIAVASNPENLNIEGRFRADSRRR